MKFWDDVMRKAHSQASCVFEEVSEILGLICFRV